MTCVPNAAHEEMIALLDMIEQTQVDRMEALNEQREGLLSQLSANDKEIGTLNEFAEFALMLRRQVEAGQIPAEVALTQLEQPAVKPAIHVEPNEMVTRRFNTAEFVGALHEHDVRKRTLRRAS